MNAKAKHYLTLAPTVLVSLFLILASGLPKFFMTADPAFAGMVSTVFGSVNILYGIAVLEILIGVLLLVPRTKTLGFLMAVGLLGGAMATGLTVNVEGMIWWFPLVLLALLMITAYVSLPELLDRAKGNPVPNTKSLTLRILGWVLVLLLLAAHAMALMSKINPPVEGTPEYAMALKLGMVGLEIPLLIVEALTIILFLIPRTSAIGAVLMIGYMGGVLATVLTHDLNDPEAQVQVARFTQSIPVIVMLGFAAFAAWIRNPELAKRLVRGKYPA